MLLPNAVFQRIPDPKAIQKEPQNNKHFPPDECVRRMFSLLSCDHPMFILAILPSKDREKYGLFTPYASCLLVQSMHVNWSNVGPLMCSESWGAVLHVEFPNRIIYEGPIGGIIYVLHWPTST
jgi:hypothetical protein